MRYYLVYPLHVVAELLQVLDVAIADLTDDEVALALALTRLSWLHNSPSSRTGSCLLAPSPRPGVVTTRQWSYGDARRASAALAGVFLTQALRKQQS